MSEPDYSNPLETLYQENHYYDPDTVEALHEGEVYGEKLLNRFVESHWITSEERTFVREQTTFLSHMKVMNKSIFILFESEKKCQKYWREVACMFPRDRRRLFWRIFIYCANHFPYIAVDLDVIDEEICDWDYFIPSLLHRLDFMRN